MSIKKKYLKNKTCKVTFKIPKNEARDAARAALVGEFNNWDPKATPMKRLKDGTFCVDLSLKPENKYEFRYLINDSQWVNDQDADEFHFSNFGNCENSVVEI